MRRPRSTANLVLLLLATSLPCVWITWRFVAPATESDSPHSVPIQLQIEGAKERVSLTQNADGSFVYVIDPGRESQQVLSPQELAERLYTQERSRHWLSRLFNISSPIGFMWVSIGLIGQFLFTGRMVIQWLVTEKNRQSVVPPIFWWFSLIGAMMLLTYFIWRRDIVGVLGQSFGLIVYIRNLYFIYGAAFDPATALNEVATHEIEAPTAPADIAPIRPANAP